MSNQVLRKLFERYGPTLASALIGLCLASSGCNRGAPGTAEGPAALAEKSRVTAQGQILPGGGITKLVASPGDIVREVFVAPGKQVAAGDVLVEMRSSKIQQTQLTALQQRRDDAAKQFELTVENARRQVSAVEIKLGRLAAQRSGLARKQKLLDLAKQQVVASSRVLAQLESIANDDMTKEFVGQIEIDRQQVEVGQADLAYQQKVEAHRQAIEDLDWAEKAAQQELDAAKASLAAAEQANTVSALDLDIAALSQKIDASAIVAPNAGVVLAVNATAGEATGGYPLVEMADTTHMVCEVEIDELDATLIKTGQSVKISSRAFSDQELSGRVRQIFPLVGRPQLRPIDPVARVDFRAVTAIVDLDCESISKASDWIQLHVNVEIQLDQVVAEDDPAYQCQN